MPVTFTDHAAWRTAERHMASVCLDEIGREIQTAIDNGWYGAEERSGCRIVTVRSGERFVVDTRETEAVVVTALG